MGMKWPPRLYVETVMLDESQISSSVTGDGPGGLACCYSWGRKELDTTEWLNWTELGWEFQYLKWISKEENHVRAMGTILVLLWLRSYRTSVWSHPDRSWKDEIWNREDEHDQWFSTWEKAVISILNKFVYVLLTYLNMSPYLFNL